MRVRIYYHRTSAAPLIWSMDQGEQSSEQHISGFRIEGCVVADGQDFNVPVGDENRPRVWLEILHAEHVDIRHGVAHIRGECKR